MPTRMTDAFGYDSTITYDPTQGDLPTSSTDLNNQSTTTSYSYDGSSGSNGKVTVSTKLPLESASYTTQSNTFSNCGSSNALPCFKVDSVSQQYSSAFTHTYYDSQGRVVETTQPVPVPANGNGSKSYIEVVFTTYKDQTNSVATSTPFVTTTDNANSIGWVDPNGVLDYKGKAPGLYVTYFDALGRPIAVMDPYFASGNETEVTCPGGSAATACSFYGFDNPQNSSTKFDYTATLDPNNHVSVSFRDSLGNTRHVQWYSGHYSGTGIGSISGNVNEEENIQYSALNEPTSVTDNDIGANTSVTASASYDDLGRLTSVTDPDRGNHIYSYDADGNLINDVSGTRTLGYNYDLLGRLGCVDDVTTILNATGSCTNTSTKQYLQYTYDTDTLGSKGSTDFPTGRLTKSKAITYFADGTSATVTEEMQYDARGRTITGQMLLSVPSAWEVASQLPTYYQWQPNYNDADQVQYFTTSSGSQGYTMSNVYDSTTGVQTGLGNTSGQTANLASILYNQHALVSTLNFQTSTGSALASEQFNYDANFRPTAATASWQSGSGTTGTIFSQTPSYDSASNVTSLSTTQAAVPGNSNSGGSETQNFCYDEQNRLVWAGNSGSQPAVAPAAAVRSAVASTVLATPTATRTRTWANSPRSPAMESNRSISIATAMPRTS